MTDVNEVKKERRGDLPFAYNEVVRLMKNELDDDKMVRERVKVEMNKFLGDVLCLKLWLMAMYFLVMIKSI